MVSLAIFITSVSGRGGRQINSVGILHQGVQGGSHSVTSTDAAGGAAPEVRAAKSFEFGEGDELAS